MAQKWDYYTPAKKKQNGSWWHNQGYQKDPKGTQNQAPKKEQIVGFDGKRITLPSESSYVGASASSASEVETLRGMVKKLSKGEQLNAEEQRSLEDSPRQVVAQQQRALNQERKKLNRERALEQKYRQNEEDYNQWLVREKEKYKLALKVEKERYHTEQKRIQLALEQLRNPVPEADSEEEMLPSDSEATQTAMEKRCLQAERMAWETQQAFLQLQGQMQTMKAYSMTPQAASPQLGTTGPPIPATPTGLGQVKPLNPTERVTRTAPSPQLPRPARGAQEVAKSHLKQKSPEGRTKAAKDKEKDAMEAAVIEDDEANNSLL